MQRLDRARGPIQAPQPPLLGRFQIGLDDLPVAVEERWTELGQAIGCQPHWLSSAERPDCSVQEREQHCARQSRTDFWTAIRHRRRVVAFQNVSIYLERYDC